jgi:cytochrome b561
MIKSQRFRSAIFFLGKIVLINIGLLTVNVVIARVVGWSLEELGNMHFLCGVLVLGLGASRLVTRWDRPTSPEAWLSATTEDSSLVEIMRKSRRKDSSDYSFFFLMGSAGLLCILISFFFFA